MDAKRITQLAELIDELGTEGRPAAEQLRAELASYTSTVNIEEGLSWLSDLATQL